MQRKRELVENLKTVRTFSPEDAGMPQLVDSIAKQGQKEPVLVFGKDIVVDGARRISALQILGISTVEINAGDDLIDICEIMGRQSKKRPPTVDRAVDLLTVLAPYTARRSTRPGGKQRWYELHPELPEIRQWGRQVLSFAVGDVVTPSGLARLSYLISRAAEGDELAAEMVTQIRAGVMTPHQGRLLTERVTSQLMGVTKNPAEQSRVLKNGVANLTAALAAFDTLGAPLRISSEEIKEALNQLNRNRYQLYILMRELKKELTRKEKEGS